MTLPCPHCGQATDSLKGYRLPTFLLFIGIGASFKHGLVVRCPPCMRKELGRLALINVLPANLLWVVLLVPWYGIAALRSLTKGHSSGLEGGALAPSYRQPDRPAHAISPMGKPWHDDARLRPFFRSDAPDELYALFDVAGFEVERLRVLLLRRDGNGYRARLLEDSKVRDALNTGDEITVLVADADPPLRWQPDTTPPAPRGLDAKAEAVWKILFFTVTAVMVLGVAMAGYSSESAGVEMSYLAAPLIGFFLGAWRAVPWAREKKKHPAITIAMGASLAVLFFVLAVTFFEGIFPAL